MSRSYETGGLLSHDADSRSFVKTEQSGGFCARNGLKLVTVLVIVLLLIFGIWGSTRSSSSNDVGPQFTLADHVNINELNAYMTGLNVTAQSYSGSRSILNGYNASAAYIETQLATFAPSWTVTRQYFNLRVSEELQDPFMELIGFEPKSYTLGVDYDSFSYSGSGLTFSNMSTPNDLYYEGCNPEDWVDFTRGSIAIVQRGTCSFYSKAWAAQQAGAVAIVIYNSDQRPLFYGSIAPPNDTAPLIEIPALSASYLVGDELVMLAYDEKQVSMLTINTYTNTYTTTTFNVITETPTGEANATIVVGSHLDSVPSGPGINDNGSGTSANLHLAKLFASLGYTPNNKVRFAWWGAEEVGLVGSEYYVNDLLTNDPNQLKLILANLNFDMIASPNWIRGVYNGLTDVNNVGSGVIQRLFETYFSSQNLTTIPVPFDGRSDYGPFLTVGIAAGGLFTGAEEEKSLQNRAIFGGSYNVALDVCYHEFCDTTENCDSTVFLQNVKAAANTLQTLADQTDLQTFLQKPIPAPFTALQSNPSSSAPYSSPYTPLHFSRNGWVLPSHDLQNAKHQQARPPTFYKNKNGDRVHPLRWPVA